MLLGITNSTPVACYLFSCYYTSNLFPTNRNLVQLEVIVLSNWSGNKNFVKLPRVEFHDVHIVKKKKSWVHRIRLEDMISVICHLFPIITFLTRTLIEMSIL